jgi:hypothetical protein
MSVRAFVILATAVVVSKAEGDAGLRGVVLANELSGPPMANVEVSAVAANPNITDAHGKFSFTFPDRNPGDTVGLIVRKEGYVVVNDIQLEWPLPSHPDERPLIFLLCKDGEREEWARRFYRLKIVAAVDESYRKKLEAAKVTNPAALAELQQQRDQAKEVAEQLVEGLAKQKPDVSTELYRTATRLILNGNVDQALVALTTDHNNDNPARDYFTDGGGTEQTTTIEPEATTTPTRMYSAGTVTTYEPRKTIVVRSIEGRVSFALGTAARVVDTAGKVVPAPLRAGQKVRVYYTGSTEKRVVERVIVED